MRHPLDRPIRLAAAALIALVPLAAGAQDAERLKAMIDHAKERFAAADADHDGALTKAEAEKGMPYVAKHFDEIDAQNAGKVTLSQVTKFMQAERAELQKPKAEPKKDAEPAKDAPPKKD